MNWISKHRPSPATAIALAALFVALGGVAYATIPDSNGTIHGCYQRTNGNLRVVESAGDCRSRERALDLNQQGPEGATGASGPQGPKGDKGDPGNEGSPVAYARVGRCSSCDPNSGTGQPPFSHPKNVIGVLRVQGNAGGWSGRTVDCWDLTAPALNAQMTSVGGSVTHGVDVPPDVIAACPAPFIDAMTDGLNGYFVLFQLAGGA